MLCMCLPAFSQANFGRILGAVTDQSGGAVAGATVTIVDTQRGVARTLTTDDAGEYNAPTLIPGTYMVRVEAKGFKKLERQNVLLEVGKEVRVDLTVEPGEQEQTVTVTEAMPMVETTNATLGGTLGHDTIEDLPLNGRNYQYLLTLRPGVTIYPGGGPWTTSTNGVRPDDMVYLVDGVLNDNLFDGRSMINMTSPITDAATILPVDAIQEFNTEVNPKAEMGFKPGAVVNVGLKSGTNGLHGTAFAFGRDQALDARNYFIPAPVNGVCTINGAVGARLAMRSASPVTGTVWGHRGRRYQERQALLFRFLRGSPLNRGESIHFASNEFPANERSTPTANPSDQPSRCHRGPECSRAPLSNVSLGLVGCTTSGVCGGPTALIPLNNSTSNVVSTDFPNYQHQ